MQEFARSGRKITVRLLEPDDPNDTPFVLFEADQAGLEFLGRLFAAQARFGDTGFFVGPRSAGKALFGKKANAGIYIQRVDPAGSKKPR